MTAPALTIPKRRAAASGAADHEALFAVGMAHVRRLARHVWTDHNVHDPGVTTLELLAYAVTDLCYRASFSIPDLLAGADDAATEARLRGQFFSAREILPAAPLTLADYRKLVIDVEGVKNAWLRPAAETYYADTIDGRLLRERPAEVPGVVDVSLRGLYEVTLEFMDDVTTQERRDVVVRAARRRLHANRNLCEDFVRFGQVATQDFILCAEVELAPDADVARAHAEILFRVQEYLSPPVNQYSLGEMLARAHPDGEPYTADEIFDGPALEHGFIDDAELAAAELRAEVRLSDVISVVMDVEGVRAVRDVVVNALGTAGVAGAAAPEDRWRVPVEPGLKPLLDPSASRLVFYKRAMPFTARPADWRPYWDTLAAEATARVETDAPYDFPAPRGGFRDPAAYYSFQNHFPAAYGLSEAGVAGRPTPRAQALAYQLKGYLLFFDQLMADFVAQLGAVAELFRVRDFPAADADAWRTYAHQAVTTFADHANVYGVNVDAVADTLSDRVDDKDDMVARRNRFLDHLIARFAERFDEFARAMRREFAATPESLIEHKRRFLEDYPAVSRGRGLAYDYTLQDESALWNSDNVSGLERRLARLLGVRNFTRRNLSDVTYDVYAEIDTTPDDEFRFRVRRRDEDKIILSGSANYATRALARQAMREAILAASVPGQYQRATDSEGRFYFNVLDGAGEVVARRIEYFATEALREAAIAELIEYVRVNYSDEGMYLVENILLRPDEAFELEVAGSPSDGFRFRVLRRVTGDAVLAGRGTYATAALAESALRQAFRLAADAARYGRVERGDGVHRFTVADERGVAVAESAERFESAELADAAAAGLVELLGDPFLPICPDPGCADCADQDPYSYRVHIILPAYGSRFDDFEFRQWAEGVIREETPAHVQPKVCWIGRDDMATLERLYREWVYLKSGRERARRRQKLADFIRALYAVKNVYPAARLHDCDAEEGQDKFVLGRTSLGSGE